MTNFEIGKKYMYYKDEHISAKVIKITGKENSFYKYQTICGSSEWNGLFEVGSYVAEHLVPYQEGEILFIKSDLRNGDVIEKRDGSVEIVCLETGTLINKNGFNELKDVNNDLTDNECNKYDIMAIYRPTNPYQCQFNSLAYTQGDLVFDRERDIKPKFDRQKWIDDMHKRFMNDNDAATQRLSYTNPISIMVYNTQSPNKNGIAICKDGDEFNLKTGIAVAYAKYIGVTVPKEI